MRDGICPIGSLVVWHVAATSSAASGVNAASVTLSVYYKASDSLALNFGVLRLKSLKLVSDITDRAAHNYCCRSTAAAAAAAAAEAIFYIDPVRLKTASSISDDSGDDPPATPASARPTSI